LDGTHCTAALALSFGRTGAIQFSYNIDPKDKCMSLAMTDPLDLSAIEFIEQKTGFHIKPFAALPSKIEDFLHTRYTTSLSQEVTDAMKTFLQKRKK
jgi:hypothetical protein